MKSIVLSFLLFLFSFSAFSQMDTSSVWTWVKGDSSVNQKSIYGTKGIASPTNKPGARRGALTWIDNEDNLWMYGGGGYTRDTSGGLSDLWKYSKLNNSWTWINGSDSINKPAIYSPMGVAAITNNPGAQSNRAAWKDNSGNFWMMAAATTLWKYEIGTNSWIWVSGDTATSLFALVGRYGIKGVASATNHPGSRTYDMGWTDKQGNLWLFGGSGYGNLSNGFLNDLWKYNIQTNQWTWMNGDSSINNRSNFGLRGIAANTNTPSSRSQSVTWTDTAGNFWLFGGYGRVILSPNNTLTNFYMNDLWKYDVATNRWTWMNGDTTTSTTQFSIYGTKGVASASNKPGLRGDASGVADAYGNLYMYHGWGSSSNTFVTFMSDFWKYNIATNQWTWLKGDNIGYQPSNYGNQGIAAATNKPGNRWDVQTWIDSLGNVWLFGGEGSLDVSGSGNPVRRSDLWCMTNLYTTKASGNWNDPATWYNNIVPPPGQKVIINNQVVVNVNTTVSSIQVKPGGTVRVQTGFNLIILR
jgi:hypothetical protein